MSLRFFYYVRQLGQPRPQASVDHPVGRIEKLHSLVGEVIELTEADRHLPLSALTIKYPPPEALQ